MYFACVCATVLVCKRYQECLFVVVVQCQFVCVWGRVSFCLCVWICECLCLLFLLVSTCLCVGLCECVCVCVSKFFLLTMQVCVWVCMYLFACV